MNRTLLLVIALLLLPEVALAAGGGGGEFNAGRIARHAINLVIFLGAIGYLVRKPLSDFLQFRRSEIKEGLDKAFDAKTAAEGRHAELQTRLDGFDAEVDGMMTRVADEGAREHERLIAAGEASAKQIESSTERSLAEEGRRAAESLRAEAIDLAMARAAELLSGSVGDDDHRRIAGDYISTLQEAAQR